MVRFLRRLWRWVRSRPTDISPERCVTALLLTDAVPTLAIVEGWTPEQRWEAFRWAWMTHARASDNDWIDVPEEPAHVKALPRYDWREHA